MNGNNLKWIGIVLIIVAGLLHFVEAVEYFKEATEMGEWFVAKGIASLVAAFAIYKNLRQGWVLGFLVASGSIGGYVLRRALGQPNIAVKEWFEFAGILSLVVETLFCLAAVKILSGGQSGTSQ